MMPVGQPAVRSLNILLIEDSKRNASLVEQALEGMDWRCTYTRVTDAHALGAMLQQQPWDAVISNSVPGQFSAETALEILQRHRIDAPFIVVSDASNEREAVALMKAGAHDYLPVSALARLSLVLEREMASAELRRQLAENQRALGNISSRLPGYIFQRIQFRNGSSRFTYLSASLYEQFGIDPDALMADPDNFWSLIHPDDKEAIVRIFDEAQAKLEPYHAEYRAILSDGRVVWIRARAQPTLLDNGDVLWDGIGLDVTTEKSVQEQLNYLAYFDSVTGLANRHLLLDRLDQAIKQIDRAGGGLALHMIDLDNFKDVNDTFGHAAGDTLLQQVAQRLSGAVRVIDTLARLGGDEFMLIQTNVVDKSAAEYLASKLLKELLPNFYIGDAKLQIRASIGIAFYGQLTADSGGVNNQIELVKNADLALYEAKNEGRNTYRFYNDAKKPKPS